MFYCRFQYQSACYIQVHCGSERVKLISTPGIQYKPDEEGNMNTIIAFMYSLAVYSCFQSFDIFSTKLALSKLEVEKHEINPLLVFLKKRFGLNVSFLLMWLIIANLVAVLDAFYVQNVLGFPMACYFFGIFADIL